MPQFELPLKRLTDQARADLRRYSLLNYEYCRSYTAMTRVNIAKVNTMKTQTSLGLLQLKGSNSSVQLGCLCQPQPHLPWDQY